MRDNFKGWGNFFQQRLRGGLTVQELRGKLESHMLNYKALVVMDRVRASMKVKKALHI